MSLFLRLSLNEYLIHITYIHTSYPYPHLLHDQCRSTHPPLMILVYSTYTTPTYLGRLDTIHPSIHNTPKLNYTIPYYHRTFLTPCLSCVCVWSGRVSPPPSSMPHVWPQFPHMSGSSSPINSIPSNRKYELQTYPSVSAGILSLISIISSLATMVGYPA